MNAPIAVEQAGNGYILRCISVNTAVAIPFHVMVFTDLDGVFAFMRTHFGKEVMESVLQSRGH